MKKIASLIIGMFLCLLIVPASAQINYGLRGGMNVSKLSKNIDNYNSSSATGWFVGPTVEFTVPIIGVGVDASVLYNRVNAEIGTRTNEFNYLSVPLNLKYKLCVPIVQPFIYAGPEFNISLGDSFAKEIKEVIDRRSTEWNMNVGAGVDLFSRLQFYVGYSFGFTDAIKYFDAKISTWKVGAVIFF